MFLRYNATDASYIFVLFILCTELTGKWNGVIIASSDWVSAGQNETMVEWKVSPDLVVCVINSFFYLLLYRIRLGWLARTTFMESVSIADYGNDRKVLLALRFE